MDTELAKKLIVPAAFVAVVGLCVLDAHLTRRARLKAMKIIADVPASDEDVDKTTPTES